MRTLLVSFLVVASLTVFVSASFADQIGNANRPRKGFQNQGPHQPPAPPKNHHKNSQKGTDLYCGRGCGPFSVQVSVIGSCFG